MKSYNSANLSPRVSGSDPLRSLKAKSSCSSNGKFNKQWGSSPVKFNREATNR
jgi:hypothetical protein